MRGIFFIKYHAENETGRLVPELFLFYKKAIRKVKASGQYLSFNTFWYTSISTYKKNFITSQDVDQEICSILILYKRIWD